MNYNSSDLVNKHDFLWCCHYILTALHLDGLLLLALYSLDIILNLIKLVRVRKTHEVLIPSLHVRLSVGSSNVRHLLLSLRLSSHLRLLVVTARTSFTLSIVSLNAAVLSVLLLVQ